MALGRVVRFAFLAGVAAVAGARELPSGPPANAPRQFRSDPELARHAGCARALRAGATITFQQCGAALAFDAAVGADPHAALRRRFVPAEGRDDSRSDLAPVAVRRGLGTTHRRFRQLFDGLPVFEGEISVHLGRDGTIRTVHARWHSVASGVASTTPRIDSGRATELAVAAWRRSGRAIGPWRRPPLPELGWFAVDGGLRLAWRLDLASAAPLADLRATVDALDGSTLELVDRLVRATGSGMVFSPNPVQSQGATTGLADNNDQDSVTLTALRTSVPLEGLDGTGFLRGEYANLTPSPNDAFEAALTFSYTRNDDRFEQVVAYFAVDSAQRYIQSLGFTGVLASAVGVNSAGTTADGSFYSPSDKRLYFGTGGVDDAEDEEIVLHEYGHAIQDDQLPGWGGGEMGAMGEGFGDYLAASLTADRGDPTYRAAHAACVAEWDAISYSNDDPPCLRRVDGDKQYPDDLVDEVHADGEIWSRALWDLRGAVGGLVADTLALEHHFSLPLGATMPQAALGLLDTDQALFEGAHELAILEAVCGRGILVEGCPLFLDGFESGLEAWDNF